MTNVANCRISPKVTLFYVIMPQDPSEYDLIHIACHRVFNQEVESDLIDSHEEEGHLSGRAILL